MDSVIHLLNTWGPDLQIRWGGGGHPDPEIRGGGGAAGSKNYFSTLWSSVWSKNKGGGGRPPGALPMDPPLSLQVKSIRKKNVFSQIYLIRVVRAGYKSKQLCQGIGCRISSFLLYLQMELINN